jgi:uncharacterized protein YndB with AHSA1/START domain
MADASPPGDGFEYTRVFDASRERVWMEWTEPERFADWFGGPDCEVPLPTVVMDVRPGGEWRLTMIIGGLEVHWKGEYREVVEPERLVFTITDRPGVDAPEVCTVELTDLGGGRTEMLFQQRGGNLTDDQYRATGKGWSGFFDRIAARLAG